MQETERLWAELAPRLTRAALTDITAELVAAWRAGQSGPLRRLARRLDLPAGEAPGKIFLRLVHYYHPDKFEARLAEAAACRAAGDAAGLGRIVRAFTAEATPAPARRPPPDTAFTAARTFDRRADGFHWDDETPRDDDGRDDDVDDGSLRARLAALLYDDPSRRLDPAHLADLDGDLVLAECGLEDLDGIEACVHVAELDLSGNRLHDLRPLAGLAALTRLDLSRNGIEDIDPLAFCPSLVWLDLSGNRVDSVAALLSLPDLAVVNLLGNPLADRAALAALRARGVVVVA